MRTCIFMIIWILLGNGAPHRWLLTHFGIFFLLTHIHTYMCMHTHTHTPAHTHTHTHTGNGAPRGGLLAHFGSQSSLDLVWNAERTVNYNTLQRTATHCIILPHTATHDLVLSTECTVICNKLKHAAHHDLRPKNDTHTCGAAQRCNTLQHTVTHCKTLQHTATYCNTRS